MTKEEVLRQMSLMLIESVLYVLLSIWITDARESVFCQFLRVFLGSGIPPMKGNKWLLQLLLSI